MSIVVRPIDPASHRAFLEELPLASYLHTPQWWSSKPHGKAEALGIWDGDALVGATVFQFRRPIPRLPWREVYLPHGPAVAWERTNPLGVYDALADHAAARGAIRIRVEPMELWQRWDNATVKEALAVEGETSFDDITPDHVYPAGQHLVDSVEASPEWRVPQWASIADAQLPCSFVVDVEGLDTDQIRSRMNQMYRRNVKKSEKAGVVVRQGDRSDLAIFHELHRTSAEREGYPAMPLAYFHTQFDCFDNDPDLVRVYIAEADGMPLAGGVWQRLGDHVWYTHGGSSSQHREARAVNALQWAMIRATREAGAARYDMGGVYAAIDDTTRGLLQFKVGTGGHLVRYPHERVKVLDRARSATVDGLRTGVTQARRVKASLRRRNAADATQ